MRFDLVDFVAFDIHLLERAGAAEDYDDELREKAVRRFSEMAEDRRVALSKNVGAGLPGSADGYTLTQLREHLATSAGISREKRQQNLEIGRASCRERGCQEG